MRTAEQDGGRNLREIAAELRVAADLFEVRPEDEALGRIPRAESEDRTPQVLREIAEHLESGNWRSSEDVPLGTGELLLRFPRFSQILPIYWGQDGVAISDDMQDSTVEDGIRLFIEETHPRCPLQLPSVVSECAQALALFHTEEQMDAFFCEAMGGGSGSEDFLDFFPLLARHCVDHLKEAHSPLWTPRSGRPRGDAD
ncbi:hypothetical protein E2C11_06850 [Streptomyces lavendulae]|nr:hypothetical protein [Streptomyces lavendulae]TXJ84295.1 hypothetical protein E2C11_06850 [Streptomyces lavendulae]